MRINLKQLPMLLGAGLLAAQAASGDGYRNPPPTAEGIAKSGVNAAFVDDASAISYNPANLAMQTNKSLVVSLTMARTENTYTPPGSPVSYESDGDWNYLPNLYYAQPIADGVTVGLGITTPYGQGISWDGFENFLSAATPSVPYAAEAMVLDITPSVGLKVLDNLMVGFGVDIYYSTLQLKAVNAVGPPPTPPVNSEGDGDGWGLGANAGLTWLPTEKQRVVLTFKSGVEIDYEGDFEFAGSGAGSFETTIKYPNSVGLGYGIQLSESIQLEALVEWQEWSVNDTQTLTAGPNPPQTLNNDWDDTFTFGIGGSWFATDSLTVRAGYAYLPSPIPDSTITPLLPDADRQAISVGLGYALGRNVFDIAYTFSIYSDRSSPVGSPYPGTYDIDSNLIGLTYSLSF